MIKSILKGMVIGIANIIPGVSGGTMMVSMGIYDKAIHCITHLFSEFKKSILFLLPIFIGMGIAIVGSSFGLEYLFAQFPVQTSLLFIGLVLGGLPIIIKSVKKENAAGKKTNAGHIIIGLLFFAVVAGMALLGEKEGAAANMSFTLINVLKLFGVGIVASATMVVPGVSGSMVLMMLGYYQSVLGLVNQLTRAAAAMDWALAGQSIVMLLPFLLGALIGIVLTAKGIRYLLEHHTRTTYWGILGLVLASPFAVLYGHNFAVLSAGAWLASALALAGGLAVSLLLGKNE